MKGVHRRDIADYRRTLWGAWHAASFQRSKRLPALERLLQRLGGRRAVRMSKAQILAKVKQLHALFGGVERT